MNDLRSNIGVVYNTIYNLFGYEVDIFPIGKTRTLLRKDIIMLDDINNGKKFTPKIGMKVDNPEAARDFLFEQFMKYNYDVIQVSGGLIVKFIIGNSTFNVHIFFTLDPSLLEWIYYYGYSTKYNPESKEFLLNLIADSLPPKIEEWHNKSLSIVERYSILKFSKEYGIYNVSKTFKGRHGYAKKAYETEIKTVKYTSPIDCINYFLDLDKVYLDNPNSITTEVIIDGIKKSNRITPYIKKLIMKRFNI